MNDERFNLGAAKLRIKLQEYYELGYQEGLARAAEERLCTLIRIMLGSGRMDELLSALGDQDRLKSLYHEHGI